MGEAFARTFVVALVNEMMRDGQMHSNNVCGRLRYVVEDASDLGKLNALLGDAFIDTATVTCSAEDHRAEFEAWRLSSETRVRRVVWPVCVETFAQIRCSIRIRYVQCMEFSPETPFDSIGTIRAEGTGKRLVFELFASPPLVLTVERLWVELEDTSEPTYNTPNTVEDVRIRWRGGRSR